MASESRMMPRRRKTICFPLSIESRSIETAVRSLPHLSVLRAFEATVRHGSMLRAAKELNLTPGAVSRSVRELERLLGFDLFQRGNRLVVPTTVARFLAQDVRDGLDGLASALGRAVRSATPDQPLTISCEPTFLIRWLIPRLAGLQAAVGNHREVRMVSAGGEVRFARDGIDLAIRRADFPVSDDVLAEPFLRERIGPVCRPDLASHVAARGAMRGILLHTATRPDAWTAWAALTGKVLRPSREIRFEHFYLTLQAAVAGAGLAVGPIALVADDVAAGALVAPHGFVPDGTHYTLMAARDSVDTTTYRTVLKWLTDMCTNLKDI